MRFSFWSLTPAYESKTENKSRLVFRIRMQEKYELFRSSTDVMMQKRDDRRKTRWNAKNERSTQEIPTKFSYLHTHKLFISCKNKSVRLTLLLQKAQQMKLSKSTGYFAPLSPNWTKSTELHSERITWKNEVNKS